MPSPSSEGVLGGSAQRNNLAIPLHGNSRRLPLWCANSRTTLEHMSAAPMRFPWPPRIIGVMISLQLNSGNHFRVTAPGKKACHAGAGAVSE